MFLRVVTHYYALLRVVECALTVLHSIAKTKPIPKQAIPKPPRQAGIKSTVDKDGRKRHGYCLQDAMNLTDKKAVYLDFRVSRYITEMLIYI
jgi:hypothetical protein